MSYEVKSLNEECGIFGVWGHPDAASVAYFGLHSLQHRGQEGAGIVSNDRGKLMGHRDLGLLSEVFAGGGRSAAGGARRHLRPSAVCGYEGGMSRWTIYKRSKKIAAVNRRSCNRTCTLCNSRQWKCGQYSAFSIQIS